MSSLFLSPVRSDCYHYAEFMKSLDVKKTVEVHRSTCENMGLLDSCLALGNLYYVGQGENIYTLHTPYMIITLFFLCESLVKFFTGVEKDLPKALSIYETACQKGSSGACNNAGLVWQNGLPEQSPDTKRAADYFLKACKGGHKNGCFNLSTLYLKGSSSVPKDMQSALSFSLKSCELGHPYGCANAARMYRLGDGVEVDKTKAQELKEKAKKFMKS